MIELKNISKSFEDILAVDRVGRHLLVLFQYAFQYKRLELFGYLFVDGAAVPMVQAEHGPASFPIRCANRTELLAKLDAVVQELVYLGLAPADIAERCLNWG